MQKHRQLDDDRVSGCITPVRQHVMPELHGRADGFGGGGAPDVVPDPGHDVFRSKVRLVEHAEPEPVRERPPELRVVLPSGRHGGHANCACHHVRVDGQRYPVTVRGHVKRRTAGQAVRGAERQPPERVHAPVVDEGGGGRCPRMSTSGETVLGGRHCPVVRTDLPKSLGVHQPGTAVNRCRLAGTHKIYRIYRIIYFILVIIIILLCDKGDVDPAGCIIGG